LQSTIESFLDSMEASLELGQQYIIVTDYLNVVVSKKTRLDYFNNVYNVNETMYIPLTYIQVHLPHSVLTRDDVYIFRIQEWKTNTIYNNTVTSFSFDLTIKDSDGGSKFFLEFFFQLNI